MSRISQFVALATGHLAHRHSLRDVVANLQAQGPRLYHLGVQPVARSSFARVNETQPYTLYEALFGRLCDRCRHLAPRHGFRFKNKLYSMDSSLIDLSLRIFPWAHLALGKAAMKLHLGLDHDGFLPAFAVVTEGRTNDMIGAKQFAFAKGSIVVFDKGCSDYGWRQKLTDAGVYFVTGARGNMVATVIEEGPPAKGQIDLDRRVQLTGKQKHSPNLKPLRLVGYTCPDTGRSYEFMTNIEHLSAQTIDAHGTALAGGGLYLAGGPVVGYSNRPLAAKTGASPSGTDVVLQAGAADVAGVEAAVSLGDVSHVGDASYASKNGWPGMGGGGGAVSPRAGGGAFVAAGLHKSGSLSTPPLGCR